MTVGRTGRTGRSAFALSTVFMAVCIAVSPTAYAEAIDGLILEGVADQVHQMFSSCAWPRSSRLGPEEGCYAGFLRPPRNLRP